jgi:hypothetical protein
MSLSSQEIRIQPDPVDLALAMSNDLSEDALRGYLEDRMRVLSRKVASLTGLEATG